MASKKSLWPSHHGLALMALPLILGVSLVAVALSSRRFGWPAQASESVVLTGALILSLIPLILSILDVVAERGGAVEAVGIKPTPRVPRHRSQCHRAIHDRGVALEAAHQGGCLQMSPRISVVERPRGIRFEGASAPIKCRN
jgi:hypothetical protein